MFVEENVYDASDYLEMAKKLQDLNIKIDVKKFKELTNLQFIDTTDTVWTPQS